MRRLKNKAVRVLAVMMAAAVTFTNLPVSGWGSVNQLHHFKENDAIEVLTM